MTLCDVVSDLLSRFLCYGQILGQLSRHRVGAGGRTIQQAPQSGSDVIGYPKEGDRRPGVDGRADGKDLQQPDGPSRAQNHLIKLFKLEFVICFNYIKLIFVFRHPRRSHKNG